MRYFEILNETIVGYHGSRAGDPVFKIGHTGNNAHTFGAYDSQRYGIFFSDNPEFAALYGNVKKYVLNIQDTADLNTPHIRREFIESLDPFDPVDRPFWLTVRHATGQTWQLFEDQLGERFTKFLLDNGYDSATFTEYNEDPEGNEFKSNTIVVLKPELIQETKLTENRKAKDVDDERDRIFFAYCHKNKINISDLSDNEIEKCYTDALANKDKYPIPISDPVFLYHGTARKNLSKIAQQGLVPSKGKRNSPPLWKQNSRGRIFFGETVSVAENWSKSSNHGVPVVLLRVRRDALPDAQTDTLTHDSVFVERTVPPNQIEVWDGSGWKPVGDN